MTTTLNPSLAFIVRMVEGEADAICFVADLGQPLEAQATAYLQHEELDTSTMTDCYWQNALEDQYGNRYEPKVNLVG